MFIFCLAQKSISFSIRILVLAKGSGPCVYCLMFLFEHLLISLKVYVWNNQTKVTHKAAWVYISLHVCILMILQYWHLNLLWMEFQKTNKGRPNQPLFPELVMSTDLLSFEHPSVLLFCLKHKLSMTDI